MIKKLYLQQQSRNTSYSHIHNTYGLVKRFAILLLFFLRFQSAPCRGRTTRASVIKHADETPQIKPELTLIYGGWRTKSTPKLNAVPTRTFHRTRTRWLYFHKWPVAVSSTASTLPHFGRCDTTAQINNLSRLSWKMAAPVAHKRTARLAEEDPVPYRDITNHQTAARRH